jgi:hypothetical protein
MRGQRKIITLNLYCDEIKECPLKIPFSSISESWTYIGILIVPENISQALYNDLVDLRCLSEPKMPWGRCPDTCKWHKNNNTEIHYQGIDDSTKYRIADKWVGYWLNDRKNIYFYILGINLSKLDVEKFGPKSQQDRHSTIYNRFFRTALKKAIKTYFFDYDTIVVKNIYHDKGNVEYHEYFPWHSIFKLQTEEDKLYFATDHIEFISSDHRESDGDEIHSHFVQLIDIILGCFMNCLHMNSLNKNKFALAKKSFDLVSRLIKNPNNKNSHYNYYKRQMIEFFPKENLKGLDENTLEYKYKRYNQFYSNRELLIEKKISGQLSIFEI